MDSSDLDPLTMVPRDNVSQPSIRHLESYLHCTHPSDSTDHATCDICRNRPHLCYACYAAQ